MPELPGHRGYSFPGECSGSHPDLRHTVPGTNGSAKFHTELRSWFQSRRTASFRFHHNILWKYTKGSPVVRSTVLDMPPAHFLQIGPASLGIASRREYQHPGRPIPCGNSKQFPMLPGSRYRSYSSTLQSQIMPRSRTPARRTAAATHIAAPERPG